MAEVCFVVDGSGEVSPCLFVLMLLCWHVVSTQRSRPPSSALWDCTSWRGSLQRTAQAWPMLQCECDPAPD